MIAATYARKSTEQTGVADDQKSVARQVEHAREYGERRGWIVAEEHVYIDDGISGAEFTNRPGFLRLMNAVKPRAPFQALVMSEESRLGREAIETAYALKQLVQAGVRVFFYLEDRERTLDSPTDKIWVVLGSGGFQRPARYLRRNLGTLWSPARSVPDRVHRGRRADETVRRSYSCGGGPDGCCWICVRAVTDAVVRVSRHFRSRATPTTDAMDTERKPAP